MASAMLLFSILFMVMTMSSANILQNPDFESPPANITANRTSSFLLLSQENKIPGWSFSGPVWYVTSGPNVSLPGNGHGVQLGPGAKINQTFRDTRNYIEYLVTFTLAPGSNCANSSTAVRVSSPHASGIIFLERRYGREMWESHAFSLGRWVDDSLKHIFYLEFESISTDADSVACWPVVDTVLLTGIERISSDNMVRNSGFEDGPKFVNNSSEGVLLHGKPTGPPSALEEWSIIGTVKYIDSKHYSVPQGKAAIQLVSGASSSIKTILDISKGSKYTLEFMMGDANDSCVADFTVQAKVGLIKRNFSMRSNGRGLSQKCSITFKAISDVNFITFASLTESQTSDHVFCGPVIDNVGLHPSDGMKPKLHKGVLISSMFLSLLFLLIC